MASPTQLDRIEDKLDWIIANGPSENTDPMPPPPPPRPTIGQ